MVTAKDLLDWIADGISQIRQQGVIANYNVDDDGKLESSIYVSSFRCDELYSLAAIMDAIYLHDIAIYGMDGSCELCRTVKVNVVSSGSYLTLNVTHVLSSKESP